MLNVKKKWRGYFTFSKRERNVGLVLMCMIILVTILPSFTGFIEKPNSKVDDDLLAQLEIPENKFVEEIDTHKSENNYYNNTWKSGDKKFEKSNYQQLNKNTITLFEFNPNTINKSQWEQLGIAPYLAQRLSTYTEKGGRFKAKEDLLKTYGFTTNDLERLSNYILIDSADFVVGKPINKVVTLPDNPQITELNTATKEQLMALGFSGDNSTRIIKFRENAGGIYATEQLESIYGVDMEVLESRKQFLVADAKSITLININTADYTTLANHIYISDELAQAIVDYRISTGKFYSITELRKVKGMYAVTFEKLKPYLIL